MTRENVLPSLTPVATLGFFRALLRRVRHAEPPAPLVVQELMARHGTLLAQIRAVEDSASTRPPAVVAAERGVLEEAAASVFQELEQHRAVLGPQASPLPPSAAGGDRKRRWTALVGFMVGVGAVISLVGMALVVAEPKPAARTAGPAQPLPAVPAAALGIHPGGIEGHPAPGGGNDVGPEEAAARAALAQNPEDQGARLELARLRLDKQDFMSVWEETKRVLAGDPENARALSYQSQVRLAMGQPEVALEMLTRALAKDPLLLQAYIYKSQVHLRMGQEAEAREAIAEAKRRYPAQAAWLDDGFRQMAADAEGLGPAPPSGADPHAGLGGPSSSGAAGSPHGRIVPGPEAALLASVVEPTVSGTLELEPSLQGKIPAGAVVFLTVREAGFGAGPPVAAKRLPGTFPQSFTVGSADSMQGERLPETLLVEARLDTDGDASTRDDSEPRARLDDVKGGKSEVRLVLARRP